MYLLVELQMIEMHGTGVKVTTDYLLLLTVHWLQEVSFESIKNDGIKNYWGDQWHGETNLGNIIQKIKQGKV